MQSGQDPSLQQLPPQNLEAEEAIIASALINNDVIKEILDVIAPEDFYRTAHQKMFKAISDLYNHSIPADLVTLTNHLRKKGSLEEIGGAYYLANLIDTVPMVANVMDYAKIVHETACLRRLIVQSNAVIKKCFDYSGDNFGSLIDEASACIANVEYKNPDDDSFVHVSKIAMASAERYEERARNKGKPSGLTTGYYLLDSLTSGFQPSDLIIIAARPGSGKTSLALNISRHNGEKEIPHAIFSLEMSKEQLFDRKISSKTGINLQKFRMGTFNEEDWFKISDASSYLYNMPVYIDDGGGLHYSQICRRARKLKEKHGIKTIIVDHLQLVGTDIKVNRNEQLSRVTKAFKNLAKELHMPVILLSQLNRQLEQRPHPHKRPRLSDLRESGSIEEDADIVLFIYRHEMYVRKVDDDDNETDEYIKCKGDAELNMAKQRSGPVGMIRLRWDERTTSFYNLDMSRKE